MNEHAKRQRCTNFSPEEKMNCLNIIKKYKHTIENKETGSRSWKEKENAWKEVAKEFNSCSSVYRSVETLKMFYNNKKKETRKHAAQQKSLLMGTGGGQVIKLPDDPVFNLTLDIINKKTVFGLINNYDDDCGDVIHEFPIDNDKFRTGNINLKHSTPTSSTRAEGSHIENDYEPEGHIFKFGTSRSTSLKLRTPTAGTSAESSHIENDYEVERYVVEGQISPIEVENAKMDMLEMRSSFQETTNNLPNTQTGAEENLHKEETHNWDSYSARNLRMPVTKALKQNSNHKNDKNIEWQSRRRPQLTTTSSITGHYEEVARLKKEVLQAQLSILHRQEREAEEKISWEKRHREIKERRETEEYDLKRKILLLDIKIKEEQLTVLKKANQ